MKIFHTGDWHIGKTFLNKSFIPEQSEVLEEFIHRVKTESPDLIIIAGDIYDKSIPTVEAVDLLNKTLGKLVVEMKKKVVLISGNHDSADRLSFGAGILKEKGLYIVTDIESSTEPIELEDEFGRVDIYAVPYISPMKARTIFPEEGISDHDDIARVILGKIKSRWDSKSRNICVYHGFVTNSGEATVESESERPLSIGGSDEVSVSYFEGFDYVALGHLHGPQKVKHDSIRYAGSLMKYSFSEEHQRKGITEVQLGEKRDGVTEFSWNLDEMYPSRDMRVIEGTLEEILESSPSESERDDYVMVRLVSDGELYAPKDQLDRLYRNILRIEVKRERDTSEKTEGLSDSRGFEEKGVLELFKEFYENVTDSKFSAEREEKLKEILEDIELGDD